MAVARTRFPGGIVAEFTPPKRRTKKDRVVVVCGGMPSMPNKQELMELFTNSGFWAFVMRYRGSWESAGTLLKESPEKDVRLVLQGIARGFKDAATGERYRLRNVEFHVYGSSFGGPAAFFASKDPQVARVVALSPVVDWPTQKDTEPPKWFLGYIREGFGPAYRLHIRNYWRMMAGKFYNPASTPERVDGSKILVIHAKDDHLVPWRPVVKFSKKTRCRLVLRKRGGHGSSMLTPALKRRIVRFIKTGA